MLRSRDFGFSLDNDKSPFDRALRAPASRLSPDQTFALSRILIRQGLQNADLTVVWSLSSQKAIFALRNIRYLFFLPPFFCQPPPFTNSRRSSGHRTSFQRRYATNSAKELTEKKGGHKKNRHPRDTYFFCPSFSVSLRLSRIRADLAGTGFRATRPAAIRPTPTARCVPEPAAMPDIRPPPSCAAPADCGLP